ncbi:MAG: hypothetical protein AAFR87_17535 [Bacteroidota bacterium]
MKLHSLFYPLLVLGLIFACKEINPLIATGKSYQEKQDYTTLKMVMDGLDTGIDKSRLHELLGEPIDMGFDYRYLLDSVGPEGCVVGAVFHLDSEGKVDDKWIGEICE